MIESLKSAAALNSNLQRHWASDLGQEAAPPLNLPDAAAEAATLSSAIQRLITERDTHKTRAGAQELELTRLRAVNEELRRQHEQTAQLRDHYMRLATEVLTTLKHIDTAIHEVVQKTLGSRGAPIDDGEGLDAALVSLARRLSPKTAANGNTESNP